MADEAPAPSGGGGGATATTDDHAHGYEQSAPINPKSRQSTWTKSAFDIQVSGMNTPNPLSRTNSHHSMNLDDYFV